MIWENMEHGEFQGGEEIEYYKHPKRYKHLVTHSMVNSLVKNVPFLIIFFSNELDIISRSW